MAGGGEEGRAGEVPRGDVGSESECRQGRAGQGGQESKAVPSNPSPGFLLVVPPKDIASAGRGAGVEGRLLLPCAWHRSELWECSVNAGIRRNSSE